MNEIENRQDFIMANILEAGLVRAIDAADFIGVTPSSFRHTHEPQLMVYKYNGKKFFSFLEVFEHSLKNDLNFNKKTVAEIREDRKVQHVKRLDLIKRNLEK